MFQVFIRNYDVANTKHSHPFNFQYGLLEKSKVTSISPQIAFEHVFTRVIHMTNCLLQTSFAIY